MGCEAQRTATAGLCVDAFQKKLRSQGPGEVITLHIGAAQVLQPLRHGHVFSTLRQHIQPQALGQRDDAAHDGGIVRVIDQVMDK